MPDLPHLLLETVRHGRGATILVPAYIVLVSTEFLFSLALRREWSKGDALPNMASTLVGFAVNAATATVFALVYTWIYDNHHLLTLQNTALGFLSAYILFDLMAYWQHRMGHRVRFFWAIHSVHHSSNELNTAVASRIMWGISLTQPLTFFLPLAGVSIVQFAVLSLLSSIFGVIHHTRLIPALGMLDHILVTPANHRVHHGRQTKYLDKNYGQTLIIWDKLFGTHQVEMEEPDFGLVKPLRSRNPLVFQTHGLVLLIRDMIAAKDPWIAIKYLIMPPGWSHAGVQRTTAALRNELQR